MCWHDTEWYHTCVYCIKIRLNKTNTLQSKIGDTLDVLYRATWNTYTGSNVMITLRSIVSTFVEAEPSWEQSQALSYSHFQAFVGTSRYPNDIRINFHSPTAFDSRAFSYSALISNTFNGSTKILDLSIRLI